MKILSSLLAIVLWTVTTHAQPSFVPHSLSEVSGSNAGEFFGFSLACVDSGNLLGVITGIPFRTVGGQVAAGAVGIIDPRDFTNNTFISTPHPATSGRFGYSVINFDDLTSDGTDEFLSLIHI